jgi:hypothetical protein
MLPGAAFRYEGRTGFKTGYTDRAQQTFVGTATRNGRTLIVVVLGSPASPYPAAASLLDAAFGMPVDAPGTGDTLPAVAVSPFADRAADLGAFLQLGRNGASAGSSGTTTSVPVFDKLPLEPPAVANAAAGPGAKVSDGGGPGIPWMPMLFVLALLGSITFLLRRRAVKRQRLRRMARRRQRAAAMRSGGLPVVDGRYRTGMRLGQPVESHVRVQRAGER